MARLARRFADGPRGGPQESEQLFVALDTDGDGRVSEEEFLAKWHKYVCSPVFKHRYAPCIRSNMCEL